MESQLTGSHRQVYESLFRHPVARTIQWRNVWSMLGVVATAVEGQHGVVKVTRNWSDAGDAPARGERS